MEEEQQEHRLCKVRHHTTSQYMSSESQDPHIDSSRKRQLLSMPFLDVTSRSPITHDTPCKRSLPCLNSSAPVHLLRLCFHTETDPVRKRRLSPYSTPTAPGGTFRSTRTQTPTVHCPSPLKARIGKVNLEQRNSDHQSGTPISFSSHPI